MELKLDTGTEHVDVPSGFRHLLENLTVEVLRVQPSNIYKFAAEYFKGRLHERQVNGYDACLLGSQIDGFYRYEPSGHSTAKVDEAAMEITESGGKFAAKEDAAAVKIQAGYHGSRVRKELKTQNEAAVKIQSNFRGYSVRKQRGKDAEDRNKTRLPSITEEDEAAVKIQATYRGFQSRRQVQEMKKAKHEAAVKIQAGYRGFRDRKEITKRKEDAATIKIQTGHPDLKIHPAQTDAAVTIQSYFRGYKTRKDIRQSFTKQLSLLEVSNPNDMALTEHRDSQFSFSLPEDVKFEGDLDEDSDSDIDKVMDKMEAYQMSIKSMKEIHINPDEAAKFAAEKFDKEQT